MDVGKGIVAASSRCWILKPEGPVAVSLGKECKMPNILKSGPIVAGEGGINAATGGGQLGCLDNNNCHVTSVFGASPYIKKKANAIAILSHSIIQSDVG